MGGRNFIPKFVGAGASGAIHFQPTPTDTVSPNEALKQGAEDLYHTNLKILID